MTERKLHNQAETIVSILPKLQRRLSTIDDSDPAMDLPVAQMRVCGILRDGPRTMSVLSRDLGISLSAITQIADRLERTAMVERVTEPDDRRMKALQLTPHGVEVMRNRTERRVKRMREVLKHLPSEQREVVIEALTSLLNASLAITPPDVEGEA